VRGLIVFVVVVGAGLGWIVREARIQRQAVAAIKNAGGSVRYDWEWRDGNNIPGGEPWAPRWLVDLIGVDYFGHVAAVWLFSPTTATDGTLAHVGRLARLQVLCDTSSSVSDGGLAHLKRLTELSHLTLSGTQISDTGLAHLKGLTSLAHVNLSITHVTDSGLAWMPTEGKTANKSALHA
jgi:hypothetical protein